MRKALIRNPDGSSGWYIKLRKKGRPLFVTHNNEIAKMAEMVFEIRDGKLIGQWKN